MKKIAVYMIILLTCISLMASSLPGDKGVCRSGSRAGFTRVPSPDLQVAESIIIYGYV